MMFENILVAKNWTTLQIAKIETVIDAIKHNMYS